MNEPHKAILWESFEELVNAIAKRPKVLTIVVELFTDCVLHQGRLCDSKRQRLIEALKL